MLKSLCIKVNNKNVADYLLKSFQKVDLCNICISKHKFKLYNNIIIHYTGEEIDSFFDIIANTLSNVIIDFYELKIIEHIINSNYFYFTNLEQEKILNICKEDIKNAEEKELLIKKDSIFLSCLDYFNNNKSLILDGFVNFRLTNYIKILDVITDIAVNKFVIDREYSEFIDLLKMYISSKECGINIVHLIYNQPESILLDEFKNVINLDNNILNSKYLSDITFSSNDYALNTLLTLLPQVIYIHIIDIEDEFINTLKLIFDDRVYICNDCSICKIYRLEKIKKEQNFFN